MDAGHYTPDCTLHPLVMAWWHDLKVDNARWGALAMDMQIESVAPEVVES